MKIKSFEDQVRALRNGCGQLSGKMYIPWIKVQHIPSSGFSSKIYGLKTGRIHHFLSHPERYCFLLCEHNPQVIDIREQFPLLPVGLTQKVADRLNIKHPTLKYQDTTGPFVLTTDILLTKEDNGTLYYEAISVKKEPALSAKRKMELQEIEKAFFQAVGIKWNLFVESNEFVSAARNLEIFSSPFRGSYTLPDGFQLQDCLEVISLGKQRHRDVIECVCQKLKIDGFDAQRLVYFLIVNHLVKVELSHDLIKTKELIILSKSSAIVSVQGTPLEYIA